MAAVRFRLGVAGVLAIAACLLIASQRGISTGSARCVGSSADIDDSALVDLDGLALHEPRGQVGYGVLLFAYSGSERTLESRLGAATESARRLRAMDYWLPVALATNGEPERGVFDQVVAIEPRHLFDGGDPSARAPSQGGDAPFRPVRSQALTRIYYLARSPFALTLALEGTAVLCTGGVSAMLRSLLDAPGSDPNQFDLALSAGVHPRGRGASTALLLRANAASRALLRDWFVELVNTDPTGDPTPALARAAERRRAAGALRLARLNPSFIAQVQRAGPERQARTIAELSVHGIEGAVHFIQGVNGLGAQQAVGGLCEKAGRSAEPRVLVAREGAEGEPLHEAIDAIPLAPSTASDSGPPSGRLRPEGGAVLRWHGEPLAPHALSR